MNINATGQRGFTLIELAIVLVIIGLIVGGVLTGRDLVKAGEVRATATQIEKFNAAMNTFRGKFGYLPGDFKDPEASSFGFPARGPYPGEGDGNGLMEGSWYCPTCHNGAYIPGGETAMFWQDLSVARLIAEGVSTSANVHCCSLLAAANASLDGSLPAARLGGGNYFYIYSNPDTVRNYIGIGVPAGVVANQLWNSNTVGVGLTVSQAAAIDKKIDDGLPQSGNVQALLLNVAAYYGRGIIWAGVALGSPADNSGIPYTTATAGSATSCFDNGGGSGQQQYSVEISNGANVNCALSFQFQ